MLGLKLNHVSKRGPWSSVGGGYLESRFIEIPVAQTASKLMAANDIWTYKIDRGGDVIQQNESMPRL